MSIVDIYYYIIAEGGILGKKVTNIYFCRKIVYIFYKKEYYLIFS